MRKATALTLLAGSVILAGTTPAIADDQSRFVFGFHDPQPNVVQVVALDECDPVTFNPALGEEGGGFCHNVTLYGLGMKFETTLNDLVNAAKSGTPDPGWGFEPDELTIQKGTTISVVDQGGEPHTFTEVTHFGGGFVPDLNHGEATVPECEGGFSNLAVARTRILQGSHLDVANLPKGKHLFQCCIHPWMHFEVRVK